jgi:hypothetical protein
LPVTVLPKNLDALLTPYINPTNASPTNASPVEEFVQMVIQEQDADIADEKEYLGYVRYLLADESKYEIFTRFYPKNTCPGISVRMDTYQSTPRISPSDQSLLNCISTHEEQGGSVAIYFSYENHANTLWFDVTNKIINRYDPAVDADSYGQRSLDEHLSAYLGNILPDYYYIGNTLEGFQCVQGVRGQGRTHKSDYFCQDYSLLYAIRRINGMSHEEAAFDLVAKGDDVLIELAELLRALAYRIRLEQGKSVPERFRNWNPLALVQ